MTRSVAAVLLLAPAAVAALRGGGFLSLQTDMRPDVVAKTLAKVEQEWNDETAEFLECNLTRSKAGGEDAAKSCAPANFEKSCPTVVGAILRASSGTRSVVTEYMGDVCGEPALQGWMQDRCQVLSAALTDAMSEDSYENRESLDVSRFCQGFWGKFAQDEIHRAEREQKIRDEAALKAGEEAKKSEEQQKAQEAAEAKAKAEEAEEEKKKAEEEVAKVVQQAKVTAPANNTVPAHGNSSAHSANATNTTAEKKSEK